MHFNSLSLSTLKSISLSRKLFSTANKSCLISPSLIKLSIFKGLTLFINYIAARPICGMTGSKYSCPLKEFFLSDTRITSSQLPSRRNWLQVSLTLTGTFTRVP